MIKKRVTFYAATSTLTTQIPHHEVQNVLDAWRSSNQRNVVVVEGDPVMHIALELVHAITVTDAA